MDPNLHGLQYIKKEGPASKVLDPQGRVPGDWIKYSISLTDDLLCHGCSNHQGEDTVDYY